MSGAMIARLSVSAAVLSACLGTPGVAAADEGGVSFWLPGQYSSFAALPPEPGLSTAEEENFFSKSVSVEPSRTRVAHPFIKSALGAEIPKEARLVQQERAYAAPIWDNPPEGQPRNR